MRLAIPLLILMCCAEPDLDTHFSSVQIDAAFVPYLTSNPLLMEVTGAKVIHLADGKAVVLAVASTPLNDGSAADRLRAEKACRMKAIASVVAEKQGVQVAHLERLQEKTRLVLDDKSESGTSVSELLQLTTTKVEGIAKDMPPVGRWKSKEGDVFYLAIGVICDKDGKPLPAINPAGEKKETHLASGPGKEFTVTGVGADPNKAIQDAFSRAIQQAVGLLVDAEAVVKNDRLIRDEVLTYSRGYMEKYEVVRQWQEGGLYHAEIRALVARHKLVEKLKGLKLAVREVSGEIAARQIDFDAMNESQAAEIFRKRLAEFDMATLVKVQIVGNPEITRNGATANMRIKVRVSPDLAQWNKFRQNLQPVLNKTSTKRASISAVTDKSGMALANRTVGELDGPGILLSLFVQNSGQRSHWEAFRVPESMEWPIRSAARKVCRLTYTLTDDQGNTVAQSNQPIEGSLRPVPKARSAGTDRGGPRRRGRGHSVGDEDAGSSTRTHRLDNKPLVPIIKHAPKPIDEGGRSGVRSRTSRRPSLNEASADWWWVGPVWFNSRGQLITFYETENTLSLSTDELAKVRKTNVILEQHNDEDDPG
jgi:hypothetical protein